MDHPHRYTAALAEEIETRWQQQWADTGVHRQPNPGEDGFDAAKPKFYVLDMFPYPSGAGLHVGHPEGYTATDILGRYKVMTGHNLLHPMGWDAFGLPAEQYAIQTGVHPAITTRKSIDNFRRQLQRFGFGYDWDREFGTIDEGYYRWTQWIFLQLYNSWFDAAHNKARPIAELEAEFASGARAVRYNAQAAEVASEQRGEVLGAWGSLDRAAKHAVLASYRLAYIGTQTVNWCPKLGTALANEEVIDGRSERGGFPVLRKPLRQWMLRITAYGDRLLDGLADVDWPESTRIQQAEWIGRSEGAQARFELVEPPIGCPSRIEIYTTRPDTMFGATYMVVAPEHPLVDAVLDAPADETEVAALRSYVEAARNRSDVERQESKEKTGVFTGVRAVNPATGKKIPVWTSDYVLMGYGTGAIMAVPAHDQRDFEFAEAFGLEIHDVVYPPALFSAWWLGTHASDETLRAGEGDEAGWLGPIADFMGYVATNDIKPAGYAKAWELVRDRPRHRADASAAPKDRAAFINASIAEAPGNAGQRRGSVRMTWLEALEDIGFGSVEEFRARMAAPRRSKRLGEAFTEPGRAINSCNTERVDGGVDLNGMGTAEAKAAMTQWLSKSGHGQRKINYRLRDWLFSRQRYWGEPFPVVFDAQGLHHAVGEHTLPVVLPEMADYQPIESDDPKPLLAKATGWLETTAGQAGVDGLDASAKVMREANTMPGWAGSCWYYLRYCDPHNAERFIGEEAERYWLGEHGVDLYIGGAEHAVLHLLYARFWHQVLFDLGHVSSPEPFRKLFHQGLILSHAFQRDDKSLVPVDEVEERAEGEFVHTPTGDRVYKTIAKMSKTLKNVVNPDDIIAQYGADTFRLYEMYLGPLEASAPWNTDDIIGLYRFLQRAWRLMVDENTGELVFRDEPDEGVEKKLHRTIDKAGADIDRLAFNTAIAALIEFVNAATSAKGLSRDQADRFVRALAPFCPHMAAELWAKLGESTPIAHAAWPVVDPAMLKDDEVEVPVQLMGKVKAKIMVAADADAKTLEAIAMADERVIELLKGKTVRKVVAVPGRMVNIVAN